MYLAAVHGMNEPFLLLDGQPEAEGATQKLHDFL